MTSSPGATEHEKWQRQPSATRRQASVKTAPAIETRISGCCWVPYGRVSRPISANLGGSGYFLPHIRRNRNLRMGYARLITQFLDCCDERKTGSEH